MYLDNIEDAPIGGVGTSTNLFRSCWSGQTQIRWFHSAYQLLRWRARYRRNERPVRRNL